MYPIRQIIAVSLLGLFVGLQTAPLTLKYFVAMHKQIIQQELKSSHQLVSFSFSTQDWNHVTKYDSSEIEINGKLFDIKKVTYSPDTVIVTGKFDQKEDNMMKVAKGAEKKDQHTQKSLSFSSILFCEEPITYSFYKIRGNKQQNGYVIQQKSIAFTQQDSPPPKA